MIRDCSRPRAAREAASGLVAVLLLMAAPATSAAGEDSARWCDRQWWRVSASVASTSGTPDYEEMLGRWKGFSGRCGGTVVYEARLAILHVLLGDVKESERVLQRVDGIDSPYGHLREYARLVVPFVRLMNDPPADLERQLQDLEASYRAFLKLHPDVPEAQTQFGVILGVNGKKQEAVTALETALRLGRPIGMELWGLWRSLTISYEGVGRHEDARLAADEAVALRDELMSDPEFVCAAARAHAATGDLKTAEAALTGLLANNPEVKKDPDCRAAAIYVYGLKKKASE